MYINGEKSTAVVRRAVCPLKLTSRVTAATALYALNINS